MQRTSAAGVQDMLKSSTAVAICTQSRQPATGQCSLQAKKRVVCNKDSLPAHEVREDAAHWPGNEVESSKDGCQVAGFGDTEVEVVAQVGGQHIVQGQLHTKTAADGWKH